jgi:ribosomal protein L24
LELNNLATNVINSIQHSAYLVGQQDWLPPPLSHYFYFHYYNSLQRLFLCFLVYVMIQKISVGDMITIIGGKYVGKMALVVGIMPKMYQVTLLCTLKTTHIMSYTLCNNSNQSFLSQSTIMTSADDKANVVDVHKKIAEEIQNIRSSINELALLLKQINV